jgi:hypothetical protein
VVFIFEYIKSFIPYINFANTRQIPSDEAIVGQKKNNKKRKSKKINKENL